MTASNLRPPSYFTKPQEAAWRDIIKHAPHGLLEESDRLAVEVTACLLAEFRESPTSMSAAKLVRLETMLSKLGLTPRDRLRIKRPPEPADDGWDDFE